jgi:hypothetical protein
VPDYFLRTIWTIQLPAKVQAALACHPEIEVDSAAECTGRITAIFPSPRSRTLANQWRITSF